MHFRVTNTPLKSDISVVQLTSPHSPPAAHPRINQFPCPFPCSAAGTLSSPRCQWAGGLVVFSLQTSPFTPWHVTSRWHSPLAPATRATTQAQKHLAGSLPIWAPFALLLTPLWDLQLASPEKLQEVEPLAQHTVSWNKIYQKLTI